MILVPCEVAEYKMQTTTFDTDSIIPLSMNAALKKILNVTVPDGVKTYSAQLSFLKTDIDLSEEVTLNQFSDFISSVGGNLGLFVGFSFLSALLTLVEWFRKIPLKSYF